MNMLLHRMKDTEFDTFHGDTALNEWDILRELSPAKKTSFEGHRRQTPLVEKGVMFEKGGEKGVM